MSSGKNDKYEYLTGEEILLSNQRQTIEQAKFAYDPLGKAFGKQTETGALKSLKPSNKKDELKQIEGIFPQNLMTDLIRDKFKETVNFQDIIKTDSYIINQKVEKFMILVYIFIFCFFKRRT